MARVTKAQRDELVDLLRFLHEHRAQVDYPPGDVRTAADLATWHLGAAAMRQRLLAGGRIQADCSQIAQQVFRWVDLEDPCGLGYAYAGDTGAMLRHLPHYTNPRGAGRGALAIYGPGRGEHVSIVIEPGADPLLWSHGRPGVDLWRLSQQRQWHTPPVTFCAILELG